MHFGLHQQNKISLARKTINKRLFKTAGQGGAPHVKAFDFVTGHEVLSFLADDPNFRGGVYVAFADITSDGAANIITGTGFRGASHVKVFDAHTMAELRSIFAYDSAFMGAFALG